VRSSSDAGKETGLEVNTEKTKHTFMSRHQNARQNRNIKIANRYFENAARFRYLRTVSNHNLIHEEIKSRLNSGNACYRLVQNLSSSRLLSKNLKIRTSKSIVLPVVLHGRETWSQTLRQKHRLSVFGAEETIWTEET
jgi:hypothetical protein